MAMMRVLAFILFGALSSCGSPIFLGEHPQHHSGAASERGSSELSGRHDSEFILRLSTVNNPNSKGARHNYQAAFVLGLI